MPTIEQPTQAQGVDIFTKQRHLDDARNDMRKAVRDIASANRQGGPETDPFKVLGEVLDEWAAGCD